MKTVLSEDEIDIQRAGDCYDHFLEGIIKSFEEEVKEGKEPLFTTDAKNLFSLFLEGLPVEARQHYNCRACQSFVDHYGGLVRIDGKGTLHPVMWKYAPVFFDSAVAAVREKVKKADVTGVFITSESKLGTPQTGFWHHMSVNVPVAMILNNRLYSAHQVAAEKAEDHKMLLAAVSKYQISTVENAVNMLRIGSLDRSDKFLGWAEWLLAVMNEAKGKKKVRKILWPKAATAPAGFCHIASSVLGTLLDDIEEGCTFDTIQRKFNEKVDPLKYQRPQVAPTAGNVAQAEKIVDKLGIQNSLKRRFARLDEIQTIWKPKAIASKTVSSGVFAGIQTKEEKNVAANKITPRTVTMTWEKFQRTVLPVARKIEYLVRNTEASYSALVTAEDSAAPPIIQWDTEENRNPFNWYVYKGGSRPGAWNLLAGQYVDVTGIALQPNLWQSGYEHTGRAVFLILEGCKDVMNRTSALFPEIMRGELREVRATIEAYSQNNNLSGLDEASACGLRLQSDTKNWNFTLRVTSDVGTTIYNLDRWD